jgi:hypothetical protein
MNEKSYGTAVECDGNGIYTNVYSYLEWINNLIKN